MLQRSAAVISSSHDGLFLLHSITRRAIISDIASNISEIELLLWINVSVVGIRRFGEHNAS